QTSDGRPARLWIPAAFLLASLNSSEAEHQATINVLESIREPIVSARCRQSPRLPTCWRATSETMPPPTSFQAFADTELILEAPLAEDYLRSAEILRQYADANLDFVDALIAATAERLNIKRLLTLDRRDFQLIRPRHCDGFELLP